MEPPVGVEPTTYGLQIRCSTSWAKVAYRGVTRNNVSSQKILENFLAMANFFK